MNKQLLFVFGACVLLLAGCSSVPTNVNKGPVDASTYSLMKSKATATAAANERRNAVHQQIQQSIAKEMAGKGLKQVASQGDVLVGYMVIVADNATTATYDEYFGYGRDSSALSDKAHKTVSKDNSRDRFEIGAIVIDVIDPQDSKVLYRNVAHMDVSEVTSANRSETINMLVASCLSDLADAK